jgi:hypothetical protein
LFFALKVFEKFDCYLEGFKNLLSNKIVSFTYGELEIFFCNHTNYKTIFDNDLSAFEQKIYEYRNGNIDLQNQDFFEKEFL